MVKVEEGGAAHDNAVPLIVRQECHVYFAWPCRVEGWLSRSGPCRVLATQASSPLVYVPIEAIASKWYGEPTILPQRPTDQIFAH